MKPTSVRLSGNELSEEQTRTHYHVANSPHTCWQQYENSHNDTNVDIYMFEIKLNDGWETTKYGVVNTGFQYTRKEVNFQSLRC